MYQVWRDSDLVQRVPIIVTGNDFSTLFAPLVRDGRMTKFYWQPHRGDLLNICHQMYMVLILNQPAACLRALPAGIPESAGASLMPEACT